MCRIVPKMCGMVPKTWGVVQKCGVWCLKWEAWSWKCVAWCQKYVAWFQKCVAWCQKCVVWCQKYAVCCQKCAASEPFSFRSCIAMAGEQQWWSHASWKFYTCTTVPYIFEICILLENIDAFSPSTHLYVYCIWTYFHATQLADYYGESLFFVMKFTLMALVEMA